MALARILRLKVTNVDMFGYCGRENHPTLADNGKLVTVQKMEVEGNPAEPWDNGTTIDGRYNVWFCLREDGTPVELIDHEVTLVPEDETCNFCEGKFVSDLLSYCPECGRPREKP